MNRPKQIALTLLLIALFGLLAVSMFSYLLHDHWDDRVQVTLADGAELEVRHQGSKWHYFGFGHGFGFGGGGRVERLEFAVDNQKIVWEGLYEPVSVQLDGKTPVVIVFDRESNLDDWGLRYYRKEPEWKELPLSMLPRRLAFLNMWQHDPVVAADCDPESSSFQNSLTAVFWMCVATGKHFREVGHDNPTPEFLRHFQDEPK